MIVPVFLPHLGCKDRCIYCNQEFITNLGKIDLDSAIAQNMAIHEGPFEVGLFGGNFFGINAEEMAHLFSRFDNYRTRISGFRISTKPTGLDHKMLEILKSNNVTTVELGIPTFNDSILAALNRRHGKDELYSTYRVLKKEGFLVALQVMVGLPDETMNDIRETAGNLIRLCPDYIRVYPLAVLAGTRLGEMYQRHRFVPITFDEALDRAVFIYLSALRHGIKVVKMGLTENEIVREKVLAGHYHPAFGHLVKSRAYYLAILARLCTVPIKSENLTVCLNNRDIPHLLGHRGANQVRFEEEGIHLTWETTGQIEKDNFILRYDGNTTSGNILDGLAMF